MVWRYIPQLLYSANKDKIERFCLSIIFIIDFFRATQLLPRNNCNFKKYFGEAGGKIKGHQYPEINR